jgi:two-component system OmpR family sensor kinase
VAVARLGAGVERATRLVAQLLVLARQESSATAGSVFGPVDLGELLKRTVGDMSGAAQARRIDLGLHHLESASVAGQPDALLILLRNLVDNAIKYTPEGGTIDLDLRVGKEGVTLSVEDSGAGIAVPERERVFSRFYRVPGTEAPGSGLGLAIIKAIAQRHGATLVLDQSQRLGGLCVRLCFPATDAAVAKPAKRDFAEIASKA